MALNARETGILYTAVGLTIAYGLYLFAVQPVLAQYTELSDQVARERASFDSKVQVINSAASIEKEYEQIQATIPANESDARTAANDFSEQVVSLAENVMGSKLRDIGVVNSQPFKEAKGFEILSFPIKTVGPWQKVATLLKQFDHKGYLIRSVTLNPTNVDGVDVTCDIVLSRVVKIREKEDRRLNTRRPGSTVRRVGT